MDLPAGFPTFLSVVNVVLTGLTVLMVCAIVFVVVMFVNHIIGDRLSMEPDPSLMGAPPEVRTKVRMSPKDDTPSLDLATFPGFTVRGHRVYTRTRR